MKLCHCGEKMTLENPIGIPKIFCCMSCGATLEVDARGIEKWSNAHGNRGTYQPPEKETRRKTK